MRVKFIKDGPFAINGHKIIKFVVGDVDDISESDASELIEFGYAKEDIQGHQAVEPEHVEYVAATEVPKKRGRRKKNG